MPERMRRQQMPVDRAIHWKPLADPHYVVASLEPGGGGRRQIFIRQSVLTRVQAVAAAGGGKHVIGLLFGDLFVSPDGVDYYVIDSAREHARRVANDEGISHALSEMLATPHGNPSGQLLGWYCSSPHVDARASAREMGIHLAHFPEPWQTMLLVDVAPHGGAGAFLLQDRRAARAFCAPFFELLDAEPKRGQGLRTCVAWQNYVTTDVVDAVIPLPHVEPPPSDDVGGSHDLEQASRGRAPFSSWRSLFDGAARATPASTSTRTSARPSTPTSSPTPARAAPGHASAEAPQPAHAPAEPTPLDRTPRREHGRRVSDAEDTLPSTPPTDYIELAQSEGFLVAAKFRDESARETLWILHDPYAGLLLTVATDEAEVLDASLHYNRHVDDPDALHAAFEEHRDLESRTLYFREACLHGLRAKCRRLRATQTLLREWRVSPPIYFLTPSEWQVPPRGADETLSDAEAFETLNARRTALIPEPVRHQFGLTTRDSETR